MYRSALYHGGGAAACGCGAARLFRRVAAACVRVPACGAWQPCSRRVRRGGAVPRNVGASAPWLGALCCGGRARVPCRVHGGFPFENNGRRLSLLERMVRRAHGGDGRNAPRQNGARSGAGAGGMRNAVFPCLRVDAGAFVRCARIALPRCHRACVRSADGACHLRTQTGEPEHIRRRGSGMCGGAGVPDSAHAEQPRRGCRELCTRSRCSCAVLCAGGVRGDTGRARRKRFCGAARLRFGKNTCHAL